jgi:AcrR family transcriptional regulator
MGTDTTNPVGPEDAGSTRNRILSAAAELFATKGYHGTGVAEIGDRAEIKRGALYYHIKSKEELLFDVIRPHVEMSLAGARAILESDLDIVEKFRALARHHLRTIVDHRQEIAIVLRDVDALTPERRAQVRGMQTEVEAAWQSVVEEGARAGVFRSADPALVRGILSMLNMVFSWYRESHGRTPEELADIYSDLLLGGLLTDQRRAHPWPA